MVNGIIEELQDLDMDPKPESLRWTSTHKCEDMITLRVGSRGNNWDLLFVKSSRVLDVVITGMGKDSKAQGELCARAWSVGGGTSSYIARDGVS